MVQESYPKLQIKPENSARLWLFLCSTHFGALAIALFLPIMPMLKLSICMLIAIGLVHTVRTHALRTNACAIRSAEWSGENEWTLFMASGKRVPAQLRPSSYVQSWLVVLNFSLGTFSTRTLILLPDAVDPNLLRQLRVRLRSA